RYEREVVARPPDADQVPGLQLLVHVRGAAAALLLQQDADAVGVRVPAVPAQRVLAGQPVGQDQVDVRARRPVGQPVAVGGGEGQRGDTVGDKLLAGDGERDGG